LDFSAGLTEVGEDQPPGCFICVLDASSAFFLSIALFSQ
jgi:hypothetical protein